MSIKKDPRKNISEDEWEAKLQRVSISKEDTNTLVMNYLVTEGFVDAARQFQRESGAKRAHCHSLFHL